MWLLLLACTSAPVDPASMDSGTVDTSSDSGTTDTTEGPDRLAVLSLNLHCWKLDGTGFVDHEARFDAIAAAVADAGVDVLALQEVCVQPERDALVDLEGALEAATGDAWKGAFALAHLAWEGSADEAEEGVGLLSRVGLSEPTELAYVDPGELRRVGLFATLDDGTTVATVHLDVGDAAAREDQARQTASQVLAAAGSLDVVVAGDLNARGNSPAYGAFGEMGFVDVSEVADIDHAFVHRGGRWKGVASEAWFEGADAVSDHPGVFVELEEGTPEPVVSTRIVATVDVGFGSTLSVRGDAAPLSWERGWWAWPAASDRWELVLTEVDEGFAYKTLVDDVTWQTGEDATGEPGVDNEVRPTF